MIFHTKFLWATVEQQCSVVKVKQCAVSSVSYLYTHLNWGKVDLDDVWLGNLIWPSRANLTEWGWDLIGSCPLIRGCERIVLYCPWQTVGLLWWKRPLPSLQVLPISTLPPFSLTVPLLATILTPTASFIFHSPHIPFYQPIHLSCTPPHLRLFCLVLFMVRLQSRLHQCHCSISLIRLL